MSWPITNDQNSAIHCWAYHILWCCCCCWFWLDFRTSAFDVTKLQKIRQKEWDETKQFQVIFNRNSRNHNKWLYGEIVSNGLNVSWILLCSNAAASSSTSFHMILYVCPYCVWNKIGLLSVRAEINGKSIHKMPHNRRIINETDFANGRWNVFFLLKMF